MSDIVKRLRDPVNNWNSGDRFEAADEIERLRAALGEIVTNDRWNNKQYTGDDVWNYGACAQIAKAALGSP